MKKTFVFIFAVFLCCIMISCNSDGKGAEQDYLNATVLSIHDHYIIVKCLDVTKGNIAEGTEVAVTKDIVAANDIPDIKVNGTLRIVYTGIMETSPLKLQTVFNIYKVDDTGNVIPNETNANGYAKSATGSKTCGTSYTFQNSMHPFHLPPHSITAAIFTIQSEIPIPWGQWL